jgi:hypothetical protein
MIIGKLLMMIKCTLSAGRFDGHGSAPVHYKAHHPMQHVPGCTGIHWIPSSGDYLLLIAPAVARATDNQMTMKKYTYFAGCFNGYNDALVRYRVIA